MSTQPPPDDVTRPADRPGAAEPAQPPEPIPEGIHLPDPSIWPVVVAGGITLFMFGIVNGLGISAVGVLIFALGIGGWIGELRRG